MLIELMYSNQRRVQCICRWLWREKDFRYFESSQRASWNNVPVHDRRGNRWDCATKRVSGHIKDKQSWLFLLLFSLVRWETHGPNTIAKKNGSTKTIANGVAIRSTWKQFVHTFTHREQISQCLNVSCTIHTHLFLGFSLYLLVCRRLNRCSFLRVRLWIFVLSVLKTPSMMIFDYAIKSLCSGVRRPA